jgi:hypothetical protein
VDRTAIFTVREVPFSAAVAAAFRVGIEQGRPWLLCIDADVLPIARGIRALLEARSGLSSDCIEVQGLVHDKFFNITRPAGNHLYRTTLVKRALALIPNEGTSLKPESDMLRELASRGRPSLQSSVVVGAHDFEQYYRDIFRTNFLQARKHHNHLDYLVGYWNALAARDPDFRVALAGLEAGLNHEGAMLVDQRSTNALAAQELSRLQLVEKPPLSGTPDIDRLLAEAREGLSPAQTVASAIHQARVHALVLSASADLMSRSQAENWLRRCIPGPLLNCYRRLRRSGREIAANRRGR